MEPVSIVTIKNKISLFKKEEEANSIELIELEEVGFEMVSQKGLYNIGDKAIYIQPDFCLSDVSLFESFIRPGGDEKKCRLGSNRRIRAIKFNLHRGDDEPVYSNGILLPYNEVKSFLLNVDLESVNLTELLNIVKWEEPDPRGGVNSGKSRQFPEGLYKTDEENINNVWGHIEHKIGYPVHLVGSMKVDGSSITIGIKDNKDIICSRQLEKPLFVEKIVGRRKKTLLEKILFWTIPNLNILEIVENNDDFTKYGKPYLDLLRSKNYDNIFLRGELNGGSMKGSGNKNNPSRKDAPNVKFFNIDELENGAFRKVSQERFKEVCADLNLTTCPEIFSRVFVSKEDLLQECNNYFKEHLIEGIVVKTLNTKFSAKIMNLEYDALKK